MHALEAARQRRPNRLSLRLRMDRDGQPGEDMVELARAEAHWLFNALLITPPVNGYVIWL